MATPNNQLSFFPYQGLAHPANLSAKFSRGNLYRANFNAKLWLGCGQGAKNGSTNTKSESAAGTMNSVRRSYFAGSKTEFAKARLTDPAQGIFRSPFLERLFPTFPATWCNLCWGKTSRTALSHGTIGPEPHGRPMLIPLSTPSVRSHQSWLVYPIPIPICVDEDFDWLSRSSLPMPVG